MPLEESEAEELLSKVDTFMLEKSEFSALSCKYCLAIIEEYNRCLMEH